MLRGFISVSKLGHNVLVRLFVKEITLLGHPQQLSLTGMWVTFVSKRVITTILTGEEAPDVVLLTRCRSSVRVTA